jgi:hypothetical protein
MVSCGFFTFFPYKPNKKKKSKKKDFFSLNFHDTILLSPQQKKTQLNFHLSIFMSLFDVAAVADT